MNRRGRTAETISATDARFSSSSYMPAGHSQSSLCGALIDAGTHFNAQGSAQLRGAPWCAYVEGDHAEARPGRHALQMGGLDRVRDAASRCAPGRQPETGTQGQIASRDIL